ncbi:hypothetical protein IAT38_006482 [Cryptococcus sp. DSM 104549]
MSNTKRLASGAALVTLFAFGTISLLVPTGTTATLGNYLALPRQLVLSASEPTCQQPAYSAPFKNTSYFDSEEFRELALEKFVKAITYPTISYDDFGEPEPAEGEPKDERWEIFGEFHKFLKEAFPLSFSHAKVELAGGYSLIFTLEGSTDARPILLTGHQDVVGIGSERDWKYPPFEGHFDGDFIWGRGTSDCKPNVIGLLFALERLIENGFKPKRTVILAFGQDEESSKYGAARVAPKLLERYGKDGIEIILDEGGLGLDSTYGALIARPAVSEKGNANLQITVTGQAGHSSTPPKHTAIGYLAHIASVIEDADLFPPTIDTDNPEYQYLQCVVEHGSNDLVPSWLVRALKKNDLGKVARGIVETDNVEKYLLQTTRAITRFNGGIKNNVLPDTATLNVNSRLEVSSTVDDYLATIRKAVLPLAKEYNLTLIFQNSTLHSGSSDSIIVSLVHGRGHAPVTSWTSEQWGVLSSAIRATFGEETIAAPSIMTGNTDTAHYLELSPNIVRWSPARVGTRFNAHGPNERIKLTTLLEAIKFYHELILRFDETA